MALRHLIGVAAAVLMLGIVPSFAARDHQAFLDRGRGHFAMHLPMRGNAIGNRGAGRLAFGNGERFHVTRGGDFHFRRSHRDRFFAFRHHGNFFGPTWTGIYGYQPTTSWCELVLAAPWRYSSQQVNYCETMYGG